MKFNLIVCGVGGQGSILSSRIIADAAIKKGYEVRVGETFGAAMRGGSVSSHVKIGDIHSPLVAHDSADVILSMEPLESLRVSVDFLAPEGVVISDIRPWFPVDTNAGGAIYPSNDEIITELKKLGKEVHFLDAAALATKAGHPRTTNIVLIGALAALGKLPIESDYLIEAIKDRVPPKTIKVNIKAFQLGFDSIKKS
jgi:indolepyruvate ferredoxin oxidoreductase beta subunit